MQKLFPNCIKACCSWSALAVLSVWYSLLAPSILFVFNIKKK